jgi:hypothetical protein
MSVQCPFMPVQCTFMPVQCAFKSVQCAFNSVQCAFKSVQICKTSVQPLFNLSYSIVQYSFRLSIHGPFANSLLVCSSQMLCSPSGTTGMLIEQTRIYLSSLPRLLINFSSSSSALPDSQRHQERYLSSYVNDLKISRVNGRERAQNSERTWLER